MKTLILAAIRCSLMFLVTAAPFSVRPAQAYTVTLDQVGSNVVANGSGAINLMGLTFFGTGSSSVQVFAKGGLILTGPTVAGDIGQTIYTGFTGPASLRSIVTGLSFSYLAQRSARRGRSAMSDATGSGNTAPDPATADNPPQDIGAGDQARDPEGSAAHQSDQGATLSMRDSSRTPGRPPPKRRPLPRRRGGNAPSANPESDLLRRRQAAPVQCP